jgi:hypothetical protein
VLDEHLTTAQGLKQRYGGKDGLPPLAPVDALLDGLALVDGKLRL